MRLLVIALLAAVACSDAVLSQLASWTESAPFWRDLEVLKVPAIEPRRLNEETRATYAAALWMPYRDSAYRPPLAGSLLFIAEKTYRTAFAGARYCGSSLGLETVRPQFRRLRGQPARLARDWTALRTELSYDYDTLLGAFAERNLRRAPSSPARDAATLALTYPYRRPLSFERHEERLRTSWRRARDMLGRPAFNLDLARRHLLAEFYDSN